MKNILMTCCAFIAIHINSQGIIEFARWKNDAKAAYSFDSDDYGRAWYGDVNFVAGMLDTMPGVKLSFATNGGVASETYWDHANNTLLGNDFVNHSFSHDPYGTETYYLEVDSGQAIIEKNIPWQKCQVFVFPGGGSYDKPTLNNYIKTRRYIGTNNYGGGPGPTVAYNISNTFGLNMDYYFENTVAQLNKLIDDAISTGNWSMTASHQLGAPGGWGPMAADTFKKHMNYCWQKVKSNDLWFDGMTQITKYIQERENFSLQIVTENDTLLEAKFITDAIEINSSTFVENTVYDEPLTLKGTTKFGNAFLFDASPWKGNVIVKYNNTQVLSVIQNSKNIFPKPTLSVDKKFVSVSCDTSTVNIVITANPGAEIASTCTWLVPKKPSINGSGTISISVSRNMISQIRRGAIIVSYAGVVSRIVSFKQAVSDKWLSIASDSVKTAWDAVKSSFYLSANVSWQATTMAPWITITNTTGSSNQTINITIIPNPDTIIRMGWVKVSNVNGFIDSVKILQAAKPKDESLPDYLSKEANKFAFYPNPATTNINILSEQPMNNIEIVDLSGKIIYQNNTEGSLSFTIPVNSIGKGLFIIKIVFQNGNSSCRLISVQQ